MSILTRSLRLIGFGVAATLISGFGATVLAQSNWESEWAKTVEAAKKEGQVVLLLRRYEQVLEGFVKKYPEIKPITISGNGAQLAQRIIAERRAGKYLADIYIGGPYTVDSVLRPAKALAPIDEALILPEVKDGSKWITGKVRFTDPERKYNIAFLANPGSTSISYNTKLVDPKEIDSYKDLLDPKWKGKIVSLEPHDTHFGGNTQFMYYHPDLGPKYFTQLFGEMAITFSRNNRQMTDWLAAGKYAICLGCLDTEQATEQGLPIANFNPGTWEQGPSISPGSGTVSIIDRAPNPNAAKVFVNYLLSREGQIAVQNMEDRGVHYNSGRVDIPKDMVQENRRLNPDVKYWDQSDPSWSDFTPLKELGKKIMANRPQR